MRPSERLESLALLSLSLTLALSRPPGAPARLAVVAVTLAAVVALSRLGERGGALGVLRDAAPVAVLLVVYAQLQPAIEVVNPARYDALFAGLDARFLGGLVAAWRGALGRPAPLTDAAYLVYVSYYLLLVSVLVAARLRGGPEALERAAFVVGLGFYLSFAAYFLWPTSGPRVPLAEEAALGGGAVSRTVRAFLSAGEATTLDAFPSGHTGLSMLAAHLGARRFPRAAVLLWTWAAAVVFTTVYIHVHYAVDLLGGVLLFAVTLLLAAPASRLLGAHP
jgi:membrane-associated phospholipid phosphatase